MNQWGYRIPIILTLIFSGCDSQLEIDRLQKTSVQSSPVEEREVEPPEKVEEPKQTAEEPSTQDTAIAKPKTVTIANPESGIRLPEIEPLEIKGDMIIAGSSTVFPLTQTIYERFIEDGYAGIIKIDNIGSGAGFELFCHEGISDLSNSSRGIKDKEIEYCKAIGREPISFRVGTDALAVVVNPNNDFLSDVTLAELAKIFTVEKWSDVNPNWPNHKIERFVPDAESGTLDFFVEQVFDKNATPLLNALNTEFSDNPNDLLQAVGANQYAIGFFGYAYYQQNAEELKLLAIEGIEANSETVSNDTYDLARPLFIYSDPKIIRNKTQVAAFINFYLTHVNEEISTVGYFPNSQSTLDREKEKFLAAMDESTWNQYQIERMDRDAIDPYQIDPYDYEFNQY